MLHSVGCSLTFLVRRQKEILCHGGTELGNVLMLLGLCDDIACLTGQGRSQGYQQRMEHKEEKGTESISLWLSWSKLLKEYSCTTSSIMNHFLLHARSNK